MSKSQLLYLVTCACEQNSYLAQGKSTHPSLPVKVQMSPTPHREAGEPQQSCYSWIHFKNFLGKLMYWSFPAWKLGQCHFHKLVDSKEPARQLTCKDIGDSGCRRQQAAGANSCTLTFIPSCPSCPAYMLLLFWPNGTADTGGLSKSSLKDTSSSRH